MHPVSGLVAAIAAPRNASRTLGALALIAGLLVAFQAVAPAPAAAALPGAVARSAQSISTRAREDRRGDRPHRKRVTGGSGRVTGITSHVVLTRMQPRHTNQSQRPDSYVVTAIEDETAPMGSGPSPPCAVLGPAAGSDDRQLTAARPTPGTASGRSSDCPAGRRAIGSGVRVNGGRPGSRHRDDHGRVCRRADVLVRDRPGNNDGFAGDWSLDAFAVCATIAPERQVYLSSFAPGPGSADRKVAT